MGLATPLHDSLLPRSAAMSRYIFADRCVEALSPQGREFTCHSTTCQTLSRIDLVYPPSSATHRTRQIRHLPREISDYAPVSLTISLAKPPGLQLWRLSRFWALDERIQELLMEAFCNYWAMNGDSAKVPWDALKAWIRRE